MGGLEEPHQGPMLLRVEIPQRSSSTLARKNPANQHHLNYIDELDVLGYHALDARLQRYQLIGRTPVQTLLDPGGESLGAPERNLAAAAQVVPRGSVM